MAPRRDKECLAASSLSLDCGLPKNDCSLPSSDTGTRLGELPDFCLSQTQFPYLDHGMVPLPARLPGRIAAVPCPGSVYTVVPLFRRLDDC